MLQRCKKMCWNRCVTSNVLKIFWNKDTTFLCLFLNVLINSSEYDIDWNLTTSRKGYKGILRLELFLKFSRNAQSIYYEVHNSYLLSSKSSVNWNGIQAFSPSWSTKMSSKYDNRTVLNVIRKIGYFQLKSYYNANSRTFVSQFFYDSRSQ